VNLLNDPMAAGFIWRTILLIFAWTMFVQLKKEGASQFWWIKMLKTSRIVSLENYDYAGIVEKSRLIFRWLAIAATLLFLWHSFWFYRQYNPYFLWGPKPTEFTTPEGKGGLPPAIPGAGGGGKVTPGHLGTPTPDNQNAQPNNQGAPGAPGTFAPGTGTPGGSPGSFSAPGAPGMGGSRGVPSGGLAAPNPGGR
jgi:hypothetical protein